ncbi:MAG TPA: zinc-binding alcohol dehydrogenase family protein [Chitinophaga sp.]|uniref:zinc-binding alcohol dehydrogenase family protein n=1 Tax=Chitinophaga sp. TaxID=1869181 RepID=UPI002C6ED23D|nr:zinc-binding alcohol dehydrogenase family protein [Chitinophaga sp.]HVI44489.1 zinc-binding alcohol dehydrogenase family protein [Chitinophaga sp.]
MMKILTCPSPGCWEYKEAAMPVAQAGEAIIKIKRIGVCGTDLHAFNGTQPYFEYPRTLGHELSGELLKTDGVTSLQPGDTVTVIPYFHCGHCLACRSGKPNCCVTVKVLGVHIDGGMQEYIKVPASALVQGQGLHVDELALVEPLAIGLHGIRRAAIQRGEYVLVMGAGPIGLAAITFAQIAGARVIAMDIHPQRLHFCQQRLNVSHVLNTATDDVTAQLQEITGGDMAAVVIDATGHLAAINKGLYYLGHGGRYVLIGLQKEALVFSHPEFHKRETTLMSSRNATRTDFEQVIDYISNGIIDPLAYVTHYAAFDDVPSLFDTLTTPGSSAIKGLVRISD